MNGIGVDIVDLNRFDLKNERFIKHILSSKEYACFMKLDSEKRKREFLGGRFAGKEAYLKAYHKGIGGIAFHNIEILNHEDGSPYLNDENAMISISHEKDYAVAMVVVNSCK